MAVSVQSYYYSGQGRLMIAERDPTTGKSTGFWNIGNVTTLSLEITVDKFEHKEQMTGDRGIDFAMVKEKKANFKFTAESLSLDLLAIALYGSSSKLIGASVSVPETHKLAKLGMTVALAHPNVKTVVVKVGATTVTADQYDVDNQHGTVTVHADADDVVDGDALEVTYTYGAYTRLDVFTQATTPERYLRFEGLNTVNGDAVLVDMPRSAFDPMKGLELINTELAAGEISGSVLADQFITTGSRYFSERIVAVSDFVTG